MVFSTFTNLYNHHHYPIPKHFTTPKGTSYYERSLPITAPGPGNHEAAFYLYGCVYSGHFTSAESYHVWLLCLPLFTQLTVFKVHAWFSMYHILPSFSRANDTPLYGVTVFCLSIHPLIGTWVLSPSTDTMNIYAMHTCVQVFGRTCFQFSCEQCFHTYPGTELPLAPTKIVNF